MKALLIFAMFAFEPLLSAQISVAGEPVQIHGFFSQGFAYTNQNNYLTMQTTDGSGAFTDAGLNVSSQISDKLRAGAQAYVRELGLIGRGYVYLDWASVDYRFRDWLGFRAGKVKTVLGLYNDIQDAEFLYTWAILPQSLYPLDLREASFAHIGGDLYGNVSAGSLGSFSYTAYAGRTPNDTRGGYELAIAAYIGHSSNISGKAAGADFRWTTPIDGLMIGASFADTPLTATGRQAQTMLPFSVDLYRDLRFIYYAQYQWNRLQLESEYGREETHIQGRSAGPSALPNGTFGADRRSWYGAGSYRISKRLQLGAYYSRFFPNNNRPNLDFLELMPAQRHEFDKVVTARIDLKSFWDLKIEGHFINGYGDPSSARGFYIQDNPNGFAPRTNLLVIRTGFNF